MDLSNLTHGKDSGSPSILVQHKGIDGFSGRPRKELMDILIPTPSLETPTQSRSAPHPQVENPPHHFQPQSELFESSGRIDISTKEIPRFFFNPPPEGVLFRTKKSPPRGFLRFHDLPYSVLCSPHPPPSITFSAKHQFLYPRGGLCPPGKRTPFGNFNFPRGAYIHIGFPP